MVQTPGRSKRITIPAKRLLYRSRLAPEARSRPRITKAIGMTTISAYTKHVVPGAVLEVPPLEVKARKAQKVTARQRPQPERPPDEEWSPANESRRFFNWANIIWLAILHAGCLAAPFYF